MADRVRTLDDVGRQVAAISHATVGALQPGQTVTITTQVTVTREGFTRSVAKYRIGREWKGGGNERTFEVQSGPMEVK